MNKTIKPKTIMSFQSNDVNRQTWLIFNGNQIHLGQTTTGVSGIKNVKDICLTKEEAWAAFKALQSFCMKK